MLDLGTGDGRAVLDRARSEPGAFVIGIDANAAAMAEVSRRAAKPAAKGGLPNALFVVAAAEQPPPELRATADELTIQFPWGSLLWGTLALDDAAADGIAALLRTNGRALATFSIEDRDRLDVPSLDLEADRRQLARRWSDHGLEVCNLRPATGAELQAMSSTWARRLGAGRERRAWRLELERVDPAADDVNATRG